MGSGFATALRFTRAPSNSPKQKEKRRWTYYSHLDIKYHFWWNLSPLPVHGSELSQGVDVNYVCPACLLPGHVSQGLFHSYGVRRHLVNRARPMMYFTKTKISYFRFASPPTPEIPLQDCFKQLPTLWPEGLWLPGELHFSSIRSPSSLVSSSCVPSFYLLFSVLIAIFGLEEIHTDRSMLWTSDNE